MGLLEFTAMNYPLKGVIAYPRTKIHDVALVLRYRDLARRAKEKAQYLSLIPGIEPRSIVLLHFDSHLDNIEWFWAVVASGRVPAISTPLSNDLEQRRRHLLHLKEVLDDPICLTTERLLEQLAVQKDLRVQTVEELLGFDAPPPKQLASLALSKQSTEVEVASLLKLLDMLTSFKVACLMLTSGSTGNAKVVPLGHGQILYAISGKTQHHGTRTQDVFLNWIGMDHVANLTEIHMHAMFLGADQVHVQASDVVTNPMTFIKLLSWHEVAYTFAPNFFLASLQAHIVSGAKSTSADLSKLRCLISGGEANVVKTVAAVTKSLQLFGSCNNVIRPGFGMTETCAGSIYSRDAPRYDKVRGHEFASLGSPIPGLQMRVFDDEGLSVASGQAGHLEISGRVVFNGYYNDKTATSNAFSADGWLRTGDRAFVDENGFLNLVGRDKDIVIINGVNYPLPELEKAIEDSHIAGAQSSYTVIFPHRERGSPTEKICVVYLPSYPVEDMISRVQTKDAIINTVVSMTGTRPFLVLPLTEKELQKTSLGKLSKAKLKAAFERGDFREHQLKNDKIFDDYRRAQYEEPSGHIEIAVTEIVAQLFDMHLSDIGAHTSILDLGVSSVQIVALKQAVQSRLSIKQGLELPLLLANPTIRELAIAMHQTHDKEYYDPVVSMNPGGTKCPLWVIHPGVGEVLVFLPLSRYFPDRPFYALRARGFGPGETYFTSIEDAVRTYHNAVKQRQPQGPYALAGYSYGAMLAFELAKLLESNGDEVRFLGSFNLPPHIKYRMRQLDFIEVLLNLSYFLNLMSEEYAHAISPAMHELSRDEVFEHIASIAAPERLAELNIDVRGLEQWATLAYHLQSIAQDYDPTGTARSIDIFCAVPLAAVARSCDEWVTKHLNKWGDFAHEMRLHHVEGAHYTMLSPENVATFQKTLKKALAARGV